MPIELKWYTVIKDAWIVPSYDGTIRHVLKFYDDGDGPLWLFGEEYGATMLIRARSFESAWEIMLDESRTVAEEDLPEAYGIPDMLRDKFTIDWQNPMRPDGKWGRFWRAIDKRGESHAAVYERIMKRIGVMCDERGEEYPELIEGYEPQPNASGTGIVSVSVYAWMREVEPEDFKAAADPRLGITVERC